MSLLTLLLSALPNSPHPTLPFCKCAILSLSLLVLATVLMVWDFLFPILHQPLLILQVRDQTRPTQGGTSDVQQALLGTTEDPTVELIMV